MAYSGLAKEAIAGLDTYKQILVSTFENAPRTIDLGVIRECLKAEGLATTTPLVSIPYTVEALTKAEELCSTTCKSC